MVRATWPRSSILCGLAYAVSFLILASVLRRWFGFPLDDSWIHEVVARNLADYKVLGFLPGKLSSGSTSLLWTVILTLRALLIPSLSAVIYCAGLSFVLLIAIGFVLKRMTERDGMPAGVSWCLALAPAASGNFIWFGLIGMEHLLFILLCLLIISIWFDGPASGRAGRILLPVLCFLLVTTRPEGIFLLALLYLFRNAARRSTDDWIPAIGGAFCGGLVSSAVNWMTGHHLRPLTMQGRNGVMTSGSWIKLHLPFVGHSFARLISVWGVFLPENVLHGKGLLLGLPLTLCILCLLFLAVRRLRILHANRFLLLCAWAATIEVLYFLMLPFPGHGGRYIAVVVMLFLPLVLLGLREALMFARLSPRVVWATVGLVGATTAILSISAWTQVASADIEQINTEHGAMANWIEQTLPPSSIADRQIAVFDIGRIGYQMHGSLVDLGGLVDYRFHPYLVHRQTAVYLRQLGVKYVVLPGFADASSDFYAKSLALDKAEGAQLTMIHNICADPTIARLASTASETAAPCQRLYTIQYFPRSGE